MVLALATREGDEPRASPTSAPPGGSKVAGGWTCNPRGWSIKRWWTTRCPSTERGTVFAPKPVKYTSGAAK